MRKSYVAGRRRAGMIGAMPFSLAPIASVLVGTLSAQVALGIMTPLIPLLLLEQGVATDTIGAVASAYFVGFLAGTLSADRIVSRVGHIRAFVVFAALAADAALLMGTFASPWIWAVLRLVIGFQMAGLFLVVESWLNDKADAATRGRTFGAYLLVSWGGSAGGPLLLNVVPGSSGMFVGVGVAFATALVPMALTRVPNPTLGPRHRLGLPQLYRVSPLGVACCLTSGLVNSAFYALSPVYMQRLGYSDAAAAAFISTTMVAGLLVQYPVGMMSDRFGRRPMTLAALALGLVFAVVLGVARAMPKPLLMATGFVFAGMTAPLYGLGAGQTNDHIDRADFVAASGGLLFAWSLGASLGPGLAGLVMAHTGPAGLFGYLAAVLGAVGLFTLARMHIRAGIPRRRQSAFVPATVAPPRLPELAPLQESAGSTGTGSSPA